MENVFDSIPSWSHEMNHTMIAALVSIISGINPIRKLQENCLTKYENSPASIGMQVLKAIFANWKCVKISNVLF